jgi:hypothetical protein
VGPSVKKPDSPVSETGGSENSSITDELSETTMVDADD